MDCKTFRILLVDSNDEQAALIRSSLLSIGGAGVLVEVDHVPDAHAALAFVRRRSPCHDRPRPDLVLVDTHPATANGHELLEQLKSDPSLRGIPAVVLTDSSDPLTIAQAYDLHANSYLLKPSNPTDLQHLCFRIILYWAHLNCSIPALVAA